MFCLSCKRCLSGMRMRDKVSSAWCSTQTCLFSTFSLPPELFKKKSKDDKSIEYLHRWVLQSTDGDTRMQVAETRIEVKAMKIYLYWEVKRRSSGAQRRALAWSIPQRRHRIWTGCDCHCIPHHITALAGKGMNCLTYCQPQWKTVPGVSNK